MMTEQQMKAELERIKALQKTVRKEIALCGIIEFYRKDTLNSYLGSLYAMEDALRSCIYGGRCSTGLMEDFIKHG